MNSSNLPAVIHDANAELAMCLAQNRVAVQHKPWDEQELMVQFDMTLDELQEVKSSPKFAKLVNDCVMELRKSGGAIEVKAEKQFEYYMDNYIPQLMNDPDASHADKLKALERLSKSSRKLSGLEVKQPLPVAGSGTAVPQLTIVLAQPSQPLMKDITNG